MVRIVSDTSTLYSSAQAREAGFAVSPLSVTVAGETYREFDEISSQQFAEAVRAGNMPTSSQPAIGQVAEVYQEYAGEEVLNIAMAAGLSGTYDSAVAARELSETPEKITVINSRTLCGPHRCIVETAVRMAKEEKTLEEIKTKVEAMMDTAKSYLIPADFDYLRRGGRLSPLVSHMGKMTHLAPVMTQSADGRQLVMASVRRGFANAIKYVIKVLRERGVEKGWHIYVTHGADLHLAQQACKMLREVFSDVTIDMMELSPAFITQGGPSCVAVQIVRE